MKIQSYDLLKIIKNDLIKQGRTHLILLIIIILSANATIITVYKTRLLISQQENLILNKKKINDEWRNLIIEKNSLPVYSLKS